VHNSNFLIFCFGEIVFRMKRIDFFRDVLNG